MGGKEEKRGWGRERERRREDGGREGGEEKRGQGRKRGKWAKEEKIRGIGETRRGGVGEKERGEGEGEGGRMEGCRERGV